MGAARETGSACLNPPPRKSRMSPGKGGTRICKKPNSAYSAQRVPWLSCRKPATRLCAHSMIPIPHLS